VRDTFRRIWSDGRTRLFFLFLSLATMAAWMQDNILEPFGADVFGLDIRQTTRFTGYWGTATVLTLLLGFMVLRKRRPETLTDVAQGGLLGMVVGMTLLVFSALIAQSSLLYLGLLIFGAGFGFYTFGGVSLMAVMSPEPHSGAYLGLWSISILIFKGLGTFLGGVARDVSLLGMGASPAVAYGAVFALSAAGLLGAVFLVRHLDVVGFMRDTRPQQAAPTEMPAVSMEF
jgi:BCD family chlorophyll transporter-like MFS transporter